MAEKILMITPIAGAENCAALLSKQFQMSVETVSSRKEGLAALRRHDYALVIIDESLLQGGDDGGDAFLKHAGLAIPLEINFAISGTGRLVREVRAALSRRVRERELAARAAAVSLQGELSEVAAGLLLQSQLALAEPGIPPQLASRLRAVVELATRLGQRLNGPTVFAQTAQAFSDTESSILQPRSGAREAVVLKRLNPKDTAGREANESYASSAAGNPSAGIRPDFPGL